MTDIVKSEIVNQIYNENDKIFSKNDINDIINSFLGIITDELHKGNKVKIDSFGTFSSYEDAKDAAEYSISCFFQGGEILHLSNPGDYDAPDENEEIWYEIQELEVED